MMLLILNMDLHIQPMSTPPHPHRSNYIMKIVGEFDELRQTNALVLDQMYHVLKLFFSLLFSMLIHKHILTLKMYVYYTRNLFQLSWDSIIYIKYTDT